MDTWSRKDFRCKLYNDGYEALKEYYQNHKLDSLFISDDAVIQHDDKTILLGLNYLLLFENIERFDQFLKGLKYLEENLYSYRYICIGEEDDDKVELEFNVFTRPPLEIEYPYFEVQK